MHTTAAVVVTYNRKKLLDECIQALLGQSVQDLDVLVDYYDDIGHLFRQNRHPFRAPALHVPAGTQNGVARAAA
jgi:hypothetical protein